MSDAFSTFLSTVLGAIVGGVIAYAGQLKVIAEASKIRELDKLNKTEGLARSLLFKIIRIYSNSNQVHGYIETCFKNLDENGTAEPWQVFIPLANPPEHVNFTAEEMSLLLEYKDYNLFNLMASMDAAHNSLNASIAVANLERRQLTEKLRSESFAGPIASGTLTSAEMAAIRPRMIEVNSLLVGLREMAKRNDVESRQLMVDYQKFLAEKLKMNVDIQPKKGTAE